MTAKINSDEWDPGKDGIRENLFVDLVIEFLLAPLFAFLLIGQGASISEVKWLVSDGPPTRKVGEAGSVSPDPDIFGANITSHGR